MIWSIFVPSVVLLLISDYILRRQVAKLRAALHDLMSPVPERGKVINGFRGVQ